MEDDPVFDSNGIRPQQPVCYHLAIFLICFGGTNALKSATVITISEGSVYNYYERVLKAFHQLNY